MTSPQILGVYPIIGTDEPVHLIEILVERPEQFDFASVTQAEDDRPRSDWQVAYDERVVERGELGTRVVFFFHYLDLARPLETPGGPLFLPKPSPLPDEFADIDYEPP